MKKMTCKQLGGACDLEFHAETFKEMEELSKEHGKEMFKKGDKGHLEALQKMKELLNSPEALQKWFEDKRNEFNSLPHK
ncbi:MAG: DUF1059 domain-containing protein [Cytophagales bacterium]